MKEAGIVSKHKKKYKATTNSKHDEPISPNLLDRKFKPESENEAWASDLTYVWTKEGWLYLAVIIDLFSKRVIGWSMDNYMKAEMVIRALEMAVNGGEIKERLIILTVACSMQANFIGQS